MALTDVAMPEISALDLTGGYQDEDEVYLQRLSVYATIRPGDLKRGDTDGHVNGYTSLKDLLEEWTADEHKEEHTISADLGPREHELIVKGFDVDSRIVPGFKYTIRNLEEESYLWQGEARRLESVGLGYGRRLTFKGDRLNMNECYFWSDSNPNGLAFNIEAVKEGDVFTIVDTQESQPVGEVEVQNVESPQVEMDTVVEGSNIVKSVSVRFACSVKRFQHNHSVINVNTQDFEVVEGIAELVKSKGRKDAFVRAIKGISLLSIGECSLQKES